MCQSKNAIVRECFSTMDQDSKRRPATVSSSLFCPAVLSVWVCVCDCAIIKPCVSDRRPVGDYDPHVVSVGGDPV